VIDQDSDQTLTLHNVLYVPSSPVNIYSTIQFNTEGGTFTTTAKRAYLTDHTCRTLSTNQHYNHIYLLKGVVPDLIGQGFAELHAAYVALLTDAQTPSHSTWHRRFGHPGHDTVPRIKHLQCVSGLILESSDPLPQCTGCVIGKYKRSPFPTDTKTYTPLELVHSDISGPYPPALNKHRWFTTLRDHCTGFTLVHTHTHKHEAATFVQSAINKLERESGRKVLYLRTDRGSEYMSKAMQDWLNAQAIEHQPTAVESSASNGVAERVNLTLMNRVRATLAETNQPRLLWPWALNHVAHAHNFIPAGKQTKTPHELLFGEVPDVSHLRAFGAAVASWTPLNRRSDKLAPQADLGRFVGYTSSNKIFQVRRNRKGNRAWGGRRVRDTPVHAMHLPVACRPSGVQCVITVGRHSVSVVADAQHACRGMQPW
jgi:transposase InsO family protein